MTERLIVSPAVGLFEPVAGLKSYLPGSAEVSRDPVFIEVGGLLGLVGGTEVRSAFSGTLEGVLVLAGERVTRGQPVAWLRAPARDDEPTQGDRRIRDDRAARDETPFENERTA